MELFRLLGTIAVENSAANQAIDETTQKAHGSGQKIGNAFTSIGEKSLALSQKMTAISAGATGLLGVMVKSAADVKAMNAQFEQTFAGVEGKASAAMQRVADSSGIIETRLKGVGTKLYAFAKTTGMDTPQALSMMERSLQVAADSAAYYDRSLDETTESLQSFLKGNFENDAALGLSCTETTRNAAANKLYGKSYMELSEAQKQLTLLQMVEDANKLSGAMGQAARESDGWENIVGNLKEALKQLAASIGETILPTVTTFAQKTTETIQSFSKMSEGQKKVIVTLVALAAAAAPVLTVFGKMMVTIGKVVSTTSRLNTAFLGCMAAVKNYKAATEGASLAAGVANGNLTRQQAIVGGLATKINTFTTSTLKSTAASIKDTAANIVNAVAKSRVGTAASSAAAKVLAFAAAHKVAIIATLGLAAPIIALAAYMLTTGASADEVAAKITGFAEKAASMITSFANAMPAVVDNLSGAFTSVLNSVVSVLPTVIPALVNAGIELFTSLVDSLTTIIPVLMDALLQALQTIIGILPTLIPALLQAAITLFMALVEAIPTIINALVQAIPQIITAIVGVLPTLIPALLQGAVQLFMAFVQALPQVITALVQAIPQIIDAVTGMLPTLMPALQQASVQLFMAMVYALPQIATAIVQAIPPIIQALWDGLVTGLQAIWEAVKTDALTAWKNMKTAAGTQWNSIKSKILQPIEAAKSNIRSKVSAIKSVFNFSSLVSRVRSQFTSAKEKMVAPIEAAREKLRAALNRIQSLFSSIKPKLNISVPDIHVSGGKAPWGIGGKGVKPSFSVSWHKLGAIFKQPTIFDTRLGLQGVGEAGAEAVAPIDTLKKYVSEAVAAGNAGQLGQDELLKEMIESNRRTNQLLDAILQMMANQKILWNDRELGRMVRQYAR
jgi:phage-related protein|nr:MAG TPA: minor tail protein [Caudoviricetes sp.]